MTAIEPMSEAAANLARSFPGRDGRSLAECRVVAMDFDGVMTDDGVWLTADGEELVRVYRRDGLGLSLLRGAGIPCAVFSGDDSPAMHARCRKLGVPLFPGLETKLPVLIDWLGANQFDLRDCLFLGNDLNDAPCLEACNWAAAPLDCEPSLLPMTTIHLSRRGGFGAVREVCDLVLGAHSAAATR